MSTQCTPSKLVNVKPSLAASLALVIPYRTDAAVSTGTMTMALLVTIAVLALLIGALWLARRQGWVKLSPRTMASQAGIQLEASRRVSVTSAVHVVSYQGQRYFIVESHRGTAANVVPMSSNALEGEVME